ncbi:MAG: hypothetical protein AB1757_11525 [Acidobacteriota bacterium]
MKRIILSSLVALTLGLGMSIVAKAQDQGQDQPQMMTTKKKTKRVKKASSKSAQAANSPAGCVDQLIKLAEKDPLIAYEGKPEDLVNNRLLWNDPKSKCYVGGEQAMRNKLLELANTWRKKDAATVRSMLQEIKSSLPQT